jgi:uncharacterized membrane protein
MKAMLQTFGRPFVGGLIGVLIALLFGFPIILGVGIFGTAGMIVGMVSDRQ